MDKVIALLSLASFVAFIIGLVKPSVVKMPSRKKSSAVYLGGAIALSILGSILYPVDKEEVKDNGLIVYSPTDDEVVNAKPKSEFEYADLTIEKYRINPEVTRHKIVKNYVSYKSLPESANEGFYACLSEASFTKSNALRINDALELCNADYIQSPDSLSNKINFDAFQKNYSNWNGAYRPLEKLIKENMNDDSSYDHVSTSYSFELNKIPSAIVKTVFKGTNLYGAVVKQTISARVDIRSGNVVEIIEN
ncbi:hypothetical protein [Pectobacterium aroidearum]|uniref:hypothetical protein n=1 Tax=Pectobacterium aroidearum TaxID=1201031 RepID=UPI001CD6CDAA|nr:hypothetical protein [Pectobacterium aroidearum]